MATRRERPPAPGEVPTAAEVALLGYEGLVAAWAAVDARFAGPDPDGIKFRAKYEAQAPMVARLEELAALDPRLVAWVAEAEGRPRRFDRDPGDLDAAESAMALAAVRRAARGLGCAPRGPFRHLRTSTHPKEHRDD